MSRQYPHRATPSAERLRMRPPRNLYLATKAADAQAGFSVHPLIDLRRMNQKKMRMLGARLLGRSVFRG